MIILIDYWFCWDGKTSWLVDFWSIISIAWKRRWYPDKEYLLNRILPYCIVHFQNIRSLESKYRIIWLNFKMTRKMKMKIWLTILSLTTRLFRKMKINFQRKIYTRISNNIREEKNLDLIGILFEIFQRIRIYFYLDNSRLTNEDFRSTFRNFNLHHHPYPLRSLSLGLGYLPRPRERWRSEVNGVDSGQHMLCAPSSSVRRRKPPYM